MTFRDGKDDVENLQNGNRKIQIVPNMNNVNYPPPEKPNGLRKKAVIRQVLMSVVANLSVVSTGMGLGYPAVTLEQLQSTSEPFHLSLSQASWFASVNAMTCPIGGLLSGYLLDKIGRKKTIFLINVTSIIAWGLMALVPDSNDYAFIMIIISRVMIGITTGLASSPVGVYSAEVCHPDLRGRLTLGTSIGTATGILLIYILGYFIRDNWRLIAAIACGFSVFTALVMIPVPESPNWLMLKGRTEKAKKSLKFFRAISKKDTTKNPEFDAELNQLVVAPNTSGKHPSIFATLRRPEVYKPLLIMIGFFGCQQFSGIYVVIVYAVQFSIEAGVKIDPILCAILVGLTRILTTFVVGYVLDKWGRRPPAMLSGLGMSICMLVLAMSIWFPAFSVPYLGVICIILYIFTSTLGLMTLPFSMTSEVYPRDVRGLAAGITTCFGFLMSFAMIKLYPNMIETMRRENVFAFYGAVSLLAVAYVYLFLPETKGKTLQEIEDSFKSSHNLSNNTKPDVEMKDVGSLKS